MTADLRQRAQAPRAPGLDDGPSPELAAGAIPSKNIKTNSQDDSHPSGKEAHGRWLQILRGASFAVFFLSSCVAIVIAQLVGSPLYFVDRELYYAYMAMTKQSFGLTITTMTNWWGPTTIRISGDESVAGQIKQTSDGRVQFSFPQRMVLIANHQIYTDWLYLWWVGYANDPQMHGYLYIILKESLKWIPVIGQGMMFYGFIFMSRKMAVDQSRLAYRLQKLKAEHTGPDGSKRMNPMWLLLFPEGTNASDNGRIRSAKWADKIGVKDMEHTLLPRSTGMFYILDQLKGSVEYVYDCTVAYEGVPRGGFGEEYFTLAGTYFAGRPPKSVNFHWRRFRVADMPLHDAEAFEVWLRDRWYEKDALMDAYMSTGRFPASPSATKGDQPTYIETEVRTRYPLEFLQTFSVVGTLYFIYRLAIRFWARLVHGRV